MPNSAEQIREWLSQGESERVEFKGGLRDVSTLTRLISAFANVSGGVILVGVGPSGEVLGADIQEVQRTFHLALAQLINAPKVDLESTTLDGKQVVTITVGRSDRLTVSEAGAFRRIGDRSEPMSAEGISQNLQVLGAAPEDAQPIADAIHRLTERIRALEQEVKYAGSFKGQLRNYVVGGLVGAVIGVILTGLFL